MAIPPLSEYKTPWETKGAEYDPEKGKKFVHWLLTKEEAADEAKKKAQDELATAIKERDDFKAKVDDVKRKDETEVDRLKRELEEAKNKTVKPDKVEPTAQEIALEILSDNDNLTIKQAKQLAKRATGKDKAEVQADLEELMKLTGIGLAENDDDTQVQGKPGRRASTPNGPKNLLDGVDVNDPAETDKLFPRGF